MKTLTYVTIVQAPMLTAAIARSRQLQERSGDAYSDLAWLDWSAQPKIAPANSMLD